MDRELRVEKITSSDIVSLVSMGKNEKLGWDNIGAPFLTYVNHLRMERFFNEPLDDEDTAFNLEWGKRCEQRAYTLINADLDGLESQDDQAEKTKVHALIDKWCGTPDYFRTTDSPKVGDIKSPVSKTKLYDLIHPLYKIGEDGIKVKCKVSGNEVIALLRNGDKNLGIAPSKEAEKYYWQIVSNACILESIYDVPFMGELAVFCPHEDTVNKIIEWNNLLFNAGDITQGQYYVIDRKFTLPHVKDDSNIDEINIITFDIPQENKDFLTYRVKKALEMVNN
jgi:hypothetical protein